MPHGFCDSCSASAERVTTFRKMLRAVMQGNTSEFHNSVKRLGIAPATGRFDFGRQFEIAK
jgi:hypothetical protein